ncbi:hypothetical protein E3O19_15390 [Cryobacterium algoritolerans]|uniref:FAD/NAD(P)-binding domain-containing protein n=1 Tax=Cryobacterium algoritolerans TaxID=1259184 RepID=A0A4R8WI56_9MICO|nr:hypothetical protein [Cryobacterium algoritolerans]TFC10384.1 hypothetical protein E3O19_15390 [Cryobacterium algoritolerans]
MDVVYTDPTRASPTERIRYDYLINATGPKLNFAATPGLGPDSGHTVSVCTPNHAVEAARHLANEHELGDFGGGGMTFSQAGRRITSEAWMESLFRKRKIKAITQAAVTEIEPRLIHYRHNSGLAEHLPEPELPQRVRYRDRVHRHDPERCDRTDPHRVDGRNGGRLHRLYGQGNALRHRGGHVDVADRVRPPATRTRQGGIRVQAGRAARDCALGTLQIPGGQALHGVHTAGEVSGPTNACATGPLTLGPPAIADVEQHPTGSRVTIGGGWEATDGPAHLGQDRGLSLVVLRRWNRAGSPGQRAQRLSAGGGGQALERFVLASRNARG